MKPKGAKKMAAKKAKPAAKAKPMAAKAKPAKAKTMAPKSMAAKPMVAKKTPLIADPAKTMIVPPGQKQSSAGMLNAPPIGSPMQSQQTFPGGELNSVGKGSPKTF